MRSRSPKSTPRAYRGKAYWSTLEEAALIQLLFERRDEMTSRFTFKEPVFQQVVSVLKRLREKGVEKNADSCRSKWRKLKGMYEAVAALKAKSGFVGDVEKGVGETRETRREWNELVKSNIHFKPFAVNGWPHYEAVERLMLSKDPGAYTHQGAQPPVHESIDAPIPLSTSSTPSDFPPPSIPESAKQLCLSDITTSQSSASDDIYLPPHIISAMKQCTDLFKSLAETYRGFQQPPAPVPPPPPPEPAPSASASQWNEAAKRLLDYADKCKERNDEWLSEDDIAEMLVMFRKDKDAAEIYVIVADSSGNEGLIRVWTQHELERFRERQ